MTMRESSSSAQSSLLASATEDEIFVAQILFDLPSMIGMVESLEGFQWGSKRRRSNLVEGPSSSPAPSSQRTDVEIEEKKAQAKAEEEKGAAAATSSPVSPLHFSPSESDEKPRHASKKSSKKRVCYLELMQLGFLSQFVSITYFYPFHICLFFSPLFHPPF